VELSSLGVSSFHESVQASTPPVVDRGTELQSVNWFEQFKTAQASLTPNCKHFVRESAATAFAARA
jgi:hypothetical protein